MTVRYDDKVALITGAGSGIGEAISKSLAELGAKIIVLDVDDDAAYRVCEQITGDGGQAVTQVMDIGQIETIQGVVAELIETHEKIDILVNCAGIRAGFTPLVDIDIEMWDLAMRVNVTAAMLFSKYSAKNMIKRGEGGQILNITSAVAFVNGLHGPAYGCSKAAMHHLTKSSAAELAQYDIRVNSIAPGLVETPGVVTPNIEQQVKPGGVAYNPLERVIQPQEIADAALFLLSSGAQSITGQVMHVSGGGIM